MHIWDLFLRNALWPVLVWHSAIWQLYLLLLTKISLHKGDLTMAVAATGCWFLCSDIWYAFFHLSHWFGQIGSSIFCVQVCGGNDIHRWEVLWVTLPALLFLSFFFGLEKDRVSISCIAERLNLSFFSNEFRRAWSTHGREEQYGIDRQRRSIIQIWEPLDLV